MLCVMAPQCCRWTGDYSCMDHTPWRPVCRVSVSAVPRLLATWCGGGREGAARMQYDCAQGSWWVAAQGGDEACGWQRRRERSRV